MKYELAVVLLSGGIDSAVTAAIANTSYRLAIIHFNYGQRNQSEETKAVKKLVRHFKPEKYLEVDLKFLTEIGGSSLTDRSLEIPQTMPQKGEIPNTYVPFRNGIMLSISSAWAEVIGAKHIFTGVVEEDSSGYPDTREVFIRAIETAINLGRRPESKLTIHTPLIHMRKSAIILKGVELGVPFDATWSCYRGGAIACGTCPSCRLRKQAFFEAGVIDPIKYEK